MNFLYAPYTKEEKMRFIIKANKSGRTIVNTPTHLLALEPWETYINGKIVNNKEQYDIEQKKKEEDAINNLTMTALDFINFLVSSGLTHEQIEAFLNENLEVKHQLQYCQSVYCGVVKQLLVEPIKIGEVTITADLAENAFRLKAGLLPKAIENEHLTVNAEIKEAEN